MHSLLSFQASQQIKSGNDYHLALTSLTAFMDKLRKYSLKKKPDKPHEDLKSPEATINETMETIAKNKNNTNSKDTSNKTTWTILSDSPPQNQID